MYIIFFIKINPTIPQHKPIKPVLETYSFFTSNKCNNPIKPQTNPIATSKINDVYSISYIPLNLRQCSNSHLAPYFNSSPSIPSSFALSYKSLYRAQFRVPQAGNLPLIIGPILRLTIVNNKMQQAQQKKIKPLLI